MNSTLLVTYCLQIAGDVTTKRQDDTLIRSLRPILVLIGYMMLNTSRQNTQLGLKVDWIPIKGRLVILNSKLQPLLGPSRGSGQKA